MITYKKCYQQKTKVDFLLFLPTWSNFLLFPSVTPCHFSNISFDLEQPSSFFLIAPSQFSSSLSDLEQPAKSCLLCSYSHLEQFFLLGATFLILLTLLQLQLFTNLHPWSNLPKSACFTPTPALNNSSRLEQSSQSCLLCSKNPNSPNSSPHLPPYSMKKAATNQ